MGLTVMVKTAIENNPLHTTEDLGFGWKIWTSSVGGGYVSIRVNFVYYNDSIVSYFLEPQLPEERSLKGRYKRWYTPFFPSKENEVLTVKHNEDGVLYPIKQYDYSLNLKNVPDSVLKYMSPESGLLYGYKGNSGYYFQNRQAFINIKKHLNTESVILLMYSINPASRLTAIEYYLNHKQDFSETNKIDNWVETIFKKFPQTNTLRGCIMGPVDTRQLVDNMRKIVED